MNFAKLLILPSGKISQAEFATGYFMLNIIGYLYVQLIMFFPSIYRPITKLFFTNKNWDVETASYNGVGYFLLNIILVSMFVVLPITYLNIVLLAKRLRDMNFNPIIVISLCYLPLLLLLIFIMLGVDLGDFGIFIIIPFFVPNLLGGILLLSILLAQVWLLGVCFLRRSEA